MSRVSRARAPKAAEALPSVDSADPSPSHDGDAPVCSPVMSTIVRALNACQQEASGYTQAVPVFRKLYAEQKDEFIAAMELALPIILESDAKKNDSFDYVSSALSTFVSTASKNDSQSAAARSWFLSLMAEKTTSSDKTTRKRACQLIGRSLHALPDSVEIDDGTYDAVEAALIARVCDSIADVRTAAVKALHRLKDSDAVSAALTTALSVDSSADVRAAVLTVIGNDAAALPLLLKHSRDISAAVRKLCFVKLAPLLPALLSSQGAAAAAAVLRQGVSDRESAVVSAATNAIASWIHKCGDDLPTLLTRLRVHATGTDGEYVLSHALHARLIKPRSLGVPCAAAALTPARAAAWRAALDYAAGRGGAGHRGADDCARHRDPAGVEALVPGTRSFCETLSEVYASVLAADPTEDDAEDGAEGEENGAVSYAQARYTLHQLLRMSPHIDTLDAAGVSLIRDFLLDMLENLALDSETVALTIAALRVVLPADSADAGFRAWQRAQAARPQSQSKGSRRAAAAVLDSHDLLTERLTSSSAIVECLSQVVGNVVATLEGNEDLAAEREARKELRKRIDALVADQGKAAELEGMWAEYTESAAFEEACWRRLLDISRDLFGQMRGSISKHPELQRLYTTAVAPVLAGEHGLESVALTTAAVEALGLRMLCETDMGFVRAHLPHLLTGAASPHLQVRAAAVAALGDILVAFAGLGPVDPADCRPVATASAASDGDEAAAAQAAGDSLRLSADEFDSLVSIITTHALSTTPMSVGQAASTDPALLPDARADALSAPETVSSLRFSAVESLCRALLYDRLPAAMAADTLGKLIALLHRPGCSDDTKQALTVFLAAYSSPQAMPASGSGAPAMADGVAAATAGIEAGPGAWTGPFGVGASDHASMLIASLPTLVLEMYAHNAADTGAGVGTASERVCSATRLLLLLLTDKTTTAAARAALPRRPSDGHHAPVSAQNHYNVILNKHLSMASTPLARLVSEALLLASAVAETAPDAACALAKAVGVVSLADNDLSVQPRPDALPVPGTDLVARAGISRATVLAALDLVPSTVAAAAGSLAAEAAAADGVSAAVAGNAAVSGWVVATIEARAAALSAAVEAQEKRWEKAQEAGSRRGAAGTGRVTRAAAKKTSAPAASTAGAPRATRASRKVQQPESDGEASDEE